MKSFVAFPTAWWRAALPTLLLAGCARPEAVSPPPNLLPKEVITSILFDTHLLEARVETSHLSPDSARALFQIQERALLLRHGIVAADSTFQRSYRYYATHDKDLDEIYAAVIDSLTERDKKLGGHPSPSSAAEHPY